MGRAAQSCTHDRAQFSLTSPRKKETSTQVSTRTCPTHNTTRSVSFIHLSTHSGAPVSHAQHANTTVHIDTAQPPCPGCRDHERGREEGFGSVSCSCCSCRCSCASLPRQSPVHLFCLCLRCFVLNFIFSLSHVSSIFHHSVRRHALSIRIPGFGLHSLNLFISLAGVCTSLIQCVASQRGLQDPALAVACQ